MSPAPDVGDWGRPSDGLLEDRALQAVVGAQIRRDGEALVSYLEYEEAEVRARAAFALGSVQDPRARAALLQALADVDPRVRADAAFAIGQIPDTAGTRLLVEVLREEEDPGARLQLIQAVGRAGGGEAASLLLRTDVSDAELPMYALALARIGNRGINNALAVERLLELIGHSDADVRRNAAFYFGRSASSAFWSPVVPRLRERLQALDPGDAAAMWVLRALAKLSDPVDTETGITWLRDATDWRTRYAAAELLNNRQADGAVVVALTAGLADESPYVRQGVARALGQRQRPLSDTDYLFLRTWVTEHPDDLLTVRELLPALVADDPYWVLEWGDSFPEESTEREIALTALAVLPGLEIVDREFAAARGEGAVARAALLALEGRILAANRERLGQIFDVAQSALQSADPQHARAGAAMLANPRLLEFGSIDAIADVLRNQPSDNVSRILYRILAAMETDAALSVLERGLTSDLGDIRETAALGIEALTGEAPSYEALPRAVPPLEWTRLATLGRHPRVSFETDHGIFVLELDAEQAPLTVQTFIDLVQAGALDGVPFHRVVPAFVVQGGDVTTGDGFGAAPVTIRSEFTRLGFARGVAGMASSGKDTEGSQFFLTHLITPHLDGGYTSFGRVVSGLEVMDRVVQGDPLVRATVESGDVP